MLRRLKEAYHDPLPPRVSFEAPRRHTRFFIALSATGCWCLPSASSFFNLFSSKKIETIKLIFHLNFCWFICWFISGSGPPLMGDFCCAQRRGSSCAKSCRGRGDCDVRPYCH